MLSNRLPTCRGLVILVIALSVSHCGTELRKNGRKVTKMTSSDASLDPMSDDFVGKGQTLGELENDGLGQVESLALLDTSVGFRSFDAINHTYASLTGVPVTDPTVVAGFNELRGSLPLSHSVASITPGQVSAYTKLAAMYCDVAAASAPLRADIFGPLNFGQAPNVAFANPDAVIASVVNRFYRPDYASFASSVDDLDMLRELVATIRIDKTSTANVAMGLCTAVLASAGVTLY
jgi:hypothetical protein